MDAKQRLALLLLFAAAVQLAAQSPWARDKNGGYLQAAWQFIPTYGTLFDGKQDITLDHLVSERQAQLYAEYGLGRKTTLVASIPYVLNERGPDNPASGQQFPVEETGSVSGFGNVQLAVRHQFKSGKWALAGTLRVGLPAPTSRQPRLDLSTGYDAWTILPMFSAGVSTGRVYGYAWTGYGYRSAPYSHVAHAGLEAGVKCWKLWLAGFSDIVTSLENGSRPLPPPDVLTGLYANDQGWISIGGKVALELNRRWGIQAYYAGAVSGKRVPKSPAIGFGFYCKWD